MLEVAPTAAAGGAFSAVPAPDPQLAAQSPADDAAFVALAMAAVASDREFMLAAVEEDGAALRHASAAIRDDVDVVTAAVI